MVFKLFDEKQDSVASILFYGFDKLKRKKYENFQSSFLPSDNRNYHFYRSLLLFCCF